VRELDVVGGIGVDEIIAPEFHVFDVDSAQFPIREQLGVSTEVPHVADGLVATERHVEDALLIEAAEAVVAGAIQVVEERRRLLRAAPPLRQQLVEARAMRVEQTRVVFHREIDPQPALNPSVEVDQVGVGVVQERALRQEPERHRQPSAEGLDQSTMAVRFPERPKVGHLPALATGPLQRRSHRGDRALGGRHRQRQCT
jgi:hypothetical protein